MDAKWGIAWTDAGEYARVLELRQVLAWLTIPRAAIPTAAAANAITFAISSILIIAHSISSFTSFPLVELSMTRRSRCFDERQVFFLILINIIARQ